MAAFSAFVLGKDFKIQHPEVIGPVVGGIALVIAGFHWWYLRKMFDATIGDAAMQRWAERKMYKLAFEVNGEIVPGFKRGKHTGERDEKKKFKFVYYPPLSKYGYLQVAITVVLSICAGAAVMAPRGSAGQTDTPSTGNYYQMEAPR